MMQLNHLNDDIIIKICQYLALHDLISFGYSCTRFQSASINPNSCEEIIIHQDKRWIYYIIQHFRNECKKAFRFSNAKKLHLLNCHKLYDEEISIFIQNIDINKMNDNGSLDTLINQKISHNDFLKYFRKLKELHIGCKSSHFLQFLPFQPELEKLSITNVDAKFDFDKFVNENICCSNILSELSISYVIISKQTLEILSKCTNIRLLDIGSCIFDITIIDRKNNNYLFNKTFKEWNKLNQLNISNCDMLSGIINDKNGKTKLINCNEEISKIWCNILKVLLNKSSLNIFHCDLLQCTHYLTLYPFKFVPNYLHHLRLSLTIRNMSFISGMLRHSTILNKIWIDKLSIIHHYLSFIQCVPLLLFCRNRANHIVEFIDIHQATFNAFCDRLINEYKHKIYNDENKNKCKLKISVYVIHGDAFIDTITRISHILYSLYPYFQIIACSASLCQSSIDINQLKASLSNQNFKVYRNDWDVCIESL